MSRKRAETTFPVWAPASLVAMYHLTSAALAGNENDPEYDYVLDDLRIRRLLLTDLRMKSVWIALCERYRLREAELERIVTFIVRATRKYEATPHRTGTDHRAWYQDVVQLIEKVYKKLEWEVRTDPVWQDGDFQRAVVMDRLRALDLDDAQRESICNVVLWGARQCSPTYGEVLTRLADELKQRGSKRPVLAKPNAADAPAHYLALVLKWLFRKIVGTPLHTHVATICNVVTGSRVDPETVRKLREPVASNRKIPPPKN